MEVLHKIKLSQDIKNCRIELVRSQNPIFIKNTRYFEGFLKKQKLGFDPRTIINSKRYHLDEYGENLTLEK